MKTCTFEGKSLVPEQLCHSITKNKTVKIATGNFRKAVANVFIKSLRYPIIFIFSEIKAAPIDIVRL